MQYNVCNARQSIMAWFKLDTALYCTRLCTSCCTVQAGCAYGWVQRHNIYWRSTVQVAWSPSLSHDSDVRRSTCQNSPVNGRAAECAWILCFRWNISHPILWDLSGIYILVINFKKGICIKQKQSRQFNSILLISTVLFGLQWKPVFLNIVYSYIASTFGSTLVGNVNLVHCPSCKVEKRTSVHETETEVSKFKNSKFQNIFWLITSTTKYIQNLGELSALGESGRKV